jgi:uncharacterized protein
MMAAVKYLVEELGADVNAVDHEGNTAMHNAAARGDVEMILYLVAKGADPKAVNREGKTTADMANGPVQRIQPWPEALALLEKLGAVNNHKCVSCRSRQHQSSSKSAARLESNPARSELRSRGFFCAKS